MLFDARRLGQIPAARFAFPAPEPLPVDPQREAQGEVHASPSRQAEHAEPEPGAEAGVPPPEDLNERVAAIERDAFVKGYAHGERTGEEAAARRTEAMVRRLAGTIDELAALRARMLRKTERELVRLALAIAERIVKREVRTDRELLMAMARVAIDRLGDGVSATIRLNPVDYEAAMAARGGAPLGGAVEVVADPQVSRGGCFVRSDFGTIDASVQSQLTEISRVLLDAPGDEDDHRHDLPASA